MSGTPTERGDGYGAEVAGFLGDLVTREVRRMLNRLLATIMRGTAQLVLGIALTVTGVWRVATALTAVCARWLGDPILADALAGAVLLLLASGILLLAWRRMRR